MSQGRRCNSAGSAEDPIRECNGSGGSAANTTIWYFCDLQDPSRPSRTAPDDQRVMPSLFSSRSDLVKLIESEKLKFHTLWHAQVATRRIVELFLRDRQPQHMAPLSLPRFNGASSPMMPTPGIPIQNSYGGASQAAEKNGDMPKYMHLAMQYGVGRYGTGAEASGRGAVAGVNGAMSTSTAASIASGIKPGGSMGGGIGGLVGGSSMGWSSLGSSAAPGGKQDHGASAFFYPRAHQHQQQPLPHQPLPHPMYLPEHSAMLPRDGIAMHASRERVAAAQISSHLPMHAPPVLPGSAVNAMGPLSFFGQDLQAAPVNALFDNSRVPL